MPTICEQFVSRRNSLWLMWCLHVRTDRQTVRLYKRHIMDNHLHHWRNLIISKIATVTRLQLTTVIVEHQASVFPVCFYLPCWLTDLIRSNALSYGSGSYFEDLIPFKTSEKGSFAEPELISYCGFILSCFDAFHQRIERTIELPRYS